MSTQIKTNNELLKEMQRISEEVSKKKQEVELLVNIIEQLQKDYFDIADEINKK